MGIIVDFEELDNVYYELIQSTNIWSDNIADILDSINTLAGSNCLTGAGAEAVKGYLGTVHTTIVQALTLLLQTHSQNLLMYKVDYQSNIDTSTRAHIPCDKLFNIRSELAAQRTKTRSVEYNIRTAMSRISHLIDEAAPDLDNIENVYSQINSDLLNLESDIGELEQRHASNDFTETQALIDSLTSLINDYSAKDKTVKSSFDSEAMKISAAYTALESAKKAIVSKQLKRTEELKNAYDFELEHIKTLNEKENTNVEHWYKNYLNEDIGESQMRNYLENYSSTILDLFPNAKIGDEFEIPLTPTLSAYYKISEKLKGDIPVDMNYVVKDQQLELKNFSFTQELGLGTSIRGDSDGRIGLNIQDKEERSIGFSGDRFSSTIYTKTVGNNTYTYSVKVDLNDTSISAEESITTDLKQGSVTSVIGIEKKPDIVWKPKPVIVEKPQIELKMDWNFSIDWSAIHINNDVIAAEGIGLTGILVFAALILCCV